MEEAAGHPKARRTRYGAAAPRPLWSLRPGRALAAQQLHTHGDTVVPGDGQDAHKASQEGHLEHVLLVGIIVQVAREDLEAEGGASGGPQGPARPTPPLRAPGQTPRAPPEGWQDMGWPDTDLAVQRPRVLVLDPVHAVVTVGHLVGCHILDVAEVSGPLGNDAGHLPLGAQVNLQGKINHVVFVSTILSKKVAKGRQAGEAGWAGLPVWAKLLYLARPSHLYEGHKACHLLCHTLLDTSLQQS